MCTLLPLTLGNQKVQKANTATGMRQPDRSCLHLCRHRGGRLCVADAQLPAGPPGQKGDGHRRRHRPGAPSHFVSLQSGLQHVCALIIPWRPAISARSSHRPSAKVGCAALPGCVQRHLPLHVSGWFAEPVSLLQGGCSVQMTHATCHGAFPSPRLMLRTPNPCLCSRAAARCRWRTR